MIRRHPPPPCSRCGRTLVVTYDALQRPRYRCAECEGTAPAHPPHVDTPSREYPLPKAHVPRPRRSLSVDAFCRALEAALETTFVDAGRCCRRCGAPLPRGGVGRPRVQCADRGACDARAPRERAS